MIATPPALIDGLTNIGNPEDSRRSAGGEWCAPLGTWFGMIPECGLRYPGGRRISEKRARGGLPERQRRQGILRSKQEERPIAMVSRLHRRNGEE